MKGVLYIRDEYGNFIPIPAIKGAKGDKGDAGESAYTVAVANGYEGTEAEFNDALANLTEAVNAAFDASDRVGSVEEGLQTLTDSTQQSLDAVDEAFQGLQENHSGHVGDLNNPHEVTCAQIGAAAASHNQAASTITAGTFSATGVKAKSGTDYSTARVRNISAGTEDLEAGVSSLESGSLYFVYE